MGELEQLGLFESLTHGVRRPCHHGEMSEADLAVVHGLDAFRQIGSKLADRDPVAGGVGGHVAVEADPVVGAGRALFLPEVGLDEVGGKFGEVELELVDDLTNGDQLIADLLSGLTHLEHA